MDEGRISRLIDLLSEVVEVAGANERTSIYPNAEIIDDTPAGLTNYVIVSDESGHYIPALKIPGVTYTTGDTVNLLYIKGTEPIAFQHGTSSTNIGNAKVSEIWESDFGAVAWQTDASGKLTGTTADIHPQGSTNGLNARFERLFGDDVPGAAYQFTQRKFLANSGANKLGFEDSQASPYAPPGGSDFSITLAGNATAKSNSTPHWLDLFSVTTGAGSYLQWANATTKTAYEIIVALKTVRRTVDTYLGEIRFWNAANFATGPQASDTWSAVRFNYYAATYPDNPIRVEHYYSVAGTDGVTFALATGTLVSSFPYLQGFPFFISISIVPSGGNGALTARISPADAPSPGINSFGAAAAGLPDQFNYARLYIGQSNQFGYLVDQVLVA